MVSPECKRPTPQLPINRHSKLVQRNENIPFKSDSDIPTSKYDDNRPTDLLNLVQEKVSESVR